MTVSEEQEAPSHHEDWSRLLEWAESQATESLKARFATAELLARESQTTLTVLLAGVGGSAAYGASVFSPGPATVVAIASATTCAYLLLLSIFLVIRCMRFGSYPALYQDPENILVRGYSLDAVREAELDNLQKRIAEAREINSLKASRLNTVRVAAALSPVVFVIAAALAPNAQLTAEPLKIACSSHFAASSATVHTACEVRR